MKRIMKTILSATLAAAVLFVLTGCSEGQTQKKNLIGNGRYEKVEEVPDKTASGRDSLFDEQVNLDTISLKLPEEPFRIRYEIAEEGHDVSVTYSQELIQTEQGVYLELGDSNEKYIFERLENGQCLIYRYDPIVGRYLSINSLENVKNQAGNEGLIEDMTAVDQNVVNGFTIRITELFDYYEKMKGSLKYQGEETIEETVCQKYTAAYTVGQHERKMVFWIDPDTGICIKGIYYYNALDGSVYTKTILCAQIETENILLPEYK